MFGQYIRIDVLPRVREAVSWAYYYNIVLQYMSNAVSECLRAWNPDRGPGAREQAKQCIKKEIDRIFERI